MPPKRKRPAAQAKVSPHKAAKPVKTPVSKTDALFDTYADPEDVNTIGPEGIENLCSSLGVNPSDRRVLLLAWKMGAGRMGYFTREEFTHGLQALNCNSIAQLKKALPKLDSMVAQPSVFSDFYGFAFRFCLTEPGQKIIDVETTTQLLPIVMYPSSPFVAPFCEYLQEQTDYKKINLDQWNNFLRFSREVAVDLCNADDNPAWPVLLDGFIEWYRARNKS